MDQHSDPLDHHRDRHAPDTLATRELFWHNVMREILTSLSVLSAQTRPALEAEGGTGNGPPPAAPPHAELFDGRLAVLTRGGERIPIAGVAPVFACSIPGSDMTRSLSSDVQCSVFQIHTPTGEVHTVPVHELRGFHTLTDALMKQIEAATRRDDENGQPRPFGFAAFTSLARSEGAGGSLSPPDSTPIQPGQSEP